MGRREIFGCERWRLTTRCNPSATAIRQRPRVSANVSWLARAWVLRQNRWVKFDVVGTIAKVETIAAGPSVKVRSFLNKTYGRGRWRKLKGIAMVRLPNGNLRQVELHWYEAHGIGRRDFKIKGYLDEQ